MERVGYHFQGIRLSVYLDIPVDLIVIRAQKLLTRSYHTAQQRVLVLRCNLRPNLVPFDHVAAPSIFCARVKACGSVRRDCRAIEPDGRSMSHAAKRFEGCGFLTCSPGHEARRLSICAAFDNCVLCDSAPHLRRPDMIALVDKT
jgi:hypothetical protein